VKRSRRLSPPCHRKAAPGQVVIESIASMILFTIMLTLIMSICMWLYIEQALVTSAREGARQASLNAEIATSSTQASGISAVKSYVKDEVLHLTGQQLADSNITVTVPTGTSGSRTVSVSIQMNMKNPVRISDLLGALGANGSAFDSIPVGGKATMRYEE
jgi:hypothetical protein